MTIDLYHVDITWQAISPALRTAIEGVCTPRQVYVVMLRAAGYGSRETARHLGVHHSTVEEAFAAAAKRIRERYPANPLSYEGGNTNDQR